MPEPAASSDQVAVLPRRSPWALFLTLWPVMPIWRKLDTAIVMVAAYTALVVLLASETGVSLPDWSGGSTILNGIVLGLLLGFRTQAAYDRWWEGRRLWGQLVNDSRSLCTKISALGNVSVEARSELRRLVPAFATALMHRLRETGSLQRLSGFEKSPERPAHVPLFLYGRLMVVLQAERTAGRMTEVDLLFVEPHLRGFMDVCGGCERIGNTPLPQSYRALSRHGLALYLLSTPWLVTNNLLWWTIPVMALLAYFLLGVELTAEHVEEPFGRDADDLALASYCETIRSSVEQALAADHAS
jgi:putative membrane protein